MIIVELTGGVGNQMFQHAFGCVVAKKLNVKTYLSDKALKKDVQRDFELDAFAISAEKMSKRYLALKKRETLSKENLPIKILVRQKLKAFIIKYEKYFPYVPFFPILLEHFRDYSLIFNPNIFDSINDNSVLDGLWQTEKYFAGYEDIIRQEFRFASPATEPGIIKYIKMIESQANSVSLHVRLGDYTTNATMKKMVEGICDAEYYNKAIQYIVDKIAEPVTLFVFSDDIMQVKNHISFDHDVTFIKTSDHIAGTESMRLMSLCDHNIIANSSFSWWGAWLNDNPEKIVIAPDTWFNQTQHTPKGNLNNIIPDDWVRIGKG